MSHSPSCHHQAGSWRSPCEGLLAMPCVKGGGPHHQKVPSGNKQHDCCMGLLHHEQPTSGGVQPAGPAHRPPCSVCVTCLYLFVSHVLGCVPDALPCHCARLQALSSHTRCGAVSAQVPTSCKVAAAMRGHPPWAAASLCRARLPPTSEYTTLFQRQLTCHLAPT